MAEPRAVVYVVGAYDGPRKFLHEVVVLVGSLRRRQESQGVGAMRLLCLPQVVGDKLQRLVPLSLPEPIPVLDQRLRQPVRMVDELVGTPAFDAEFARPRATLVWEDTHNLPVSNLEVEDAAHAAVDACGGDLHARILPSLSSNPWLFTRCIP